jgi:superkiller protein 3
MRYYFLIFTFLFLYSCTENINESQLNQNKQENNSINDSLLVERALLNIEKGNLEEAKKDLETAILIDTTNGHTHYLLGDVLLELARQGKGSEESVKLSSFHFQSAIRYKSDSALSYQKDGIISMSFEDYSQAIVLLSTSLSVDDTDFQTFILLGNCYRKLDKVENAIHSFQKAISLNANSDEAHVQLGQLFWEKEDSTAIHYYKRAIAINPNNRDAYYNLGLVYHSIKELSKSRDAYHKIIEFGIKDSYFVEAHYNIAMILMDDYKEQHHHKNALNNYLIEVVRVNPNHYLGYFRMAICYQTLGDVRNAEQYYKKTLEINPEFKEATYKLNQLLSDNEKYK